MILPECGKTKRDAVSRLELLRYGGSQHSTPGGSGTVRIKNVEGIAVVIADVAERPDTYLKNDQLTIWFGRSLIRTMIEYGNEDHWDDMDRPRLYCTKFERHPLCHGRWASPTTSALLPNAYRDRATRILSNPPLILAVSAHITARWTLYDSTSPWDTTTLAHWDPSVPETTISQMELRPCECTRSLTSNQNVKKGNSNASAGTSSLSKDPAKYTRDASGPGVTHTFTVVPAAREHKNNGRSPTLRQAINRIRDGMDGDWPTSRCITLRVSHAPRLARNRTTNGLWPPYVPPTVLTTSARDLMIDQTSYASAILGQLPLMAMDRNELPQNHLQPDVSKMRRRDMERRSKDSPEDTKPRDNSPLPGPPHIIHHVTYPTGGTGGAKC